MDTASRITWLAAVVGLVGLWLVVVPPFLFEAPFADFWNDVFVGLALVVFAVYTAARSGDSSSRWSAAAAVVLGAWLVVGAVLWQTSPFLQWNDVVAGIAVVVIAGYSAYESHTAYASGDDSDGESSDDSANGSNDGSESE